MDSTKRYPFIPDTRVHSIQAGTKMPEKRRYFLLSVLFVLLLSLSTFRAEAAGKKITITGSTVVAKGKVIWLTADQDVKWKSSKPSVARISKRGRVKGLRAGTTVVTAISKDNPSIKKRIKIRVRKKAVQRIQLSVKSLELDVTYHPYEVVNALALPSQAAQMFAWTSKDPSIASVNAKGVVTARKEGETRITCTAMDGSERSVSFPVIVKDKEKEDAAYWNILLIGNSYTQDEFSYVPALLKEFFPQLKFRIGILYQGGCSVAAHYTKLETDGTYEMYSEYTSEDSRWTNNTSVKISSVLKEHVWKIVTLQQASAFQDSFSSMAKIPDLMEGYTQIIGKKPTFLYVFPHIRGSQNAQIQAYGSKTENAYNAFLPIALQAVRSYGFSGLIQNATAVENARKTSLNSLNTGGDGDLTADADSHLCEGIPCLVANYCSFLRLLPYMGLSSVNLTNSHILPTGSWVASQNVPNQQGIPSEVTEANRLLAVKCAEMAVQNSNTISIIS